MAACLDLQSELLDRLCLADRDGATPSRPAAPEVMVIVAHPDDEIIGAGALLPLWTGCRIVYTTDGAPRNMYDAVAAGFRTREAYANARAREAREALALAGVAAAQIDRLAFADQAASRSLAALTMCVAGLIRRHQPAAVVTHPYEGGHPDHDATAFAVHFACRHLIDRDGSAPTVIEMTSYHSRGGEIETGEFLDGFPCEVRTIALSSEDRELKRRMLACHRTQSATLRFFTIKDERYRLAPAYDFRAPPHDGPLFYERFDWGTTGAEWRSLARQAVDELQSGGDR